MSKIAELRNMKVTEGGDYYWSMEEVEPYEVTVVKYRAKR